MGYDHLRALVGEVERGEAPGARRRAASAHEDRMSAIGRPESEYRSAQRGVLL